MFCSSESDKMPHISVSTFLSDANEPWQGRAAEPIENASRVGTEPKGRTGHGQPVNRQLNHRGEG